MRIRAYGLAIVSVAVATAITALIYRGIQPSVGLLFFPAVVLPAIYGGYGPALLSTVLSTLALAYFLIPPIYPFIPFADAIRLSAFVVVAVSTAWLSAGRRRAEEAQRRSLGELQGALATLRKVSGWPDVIGTDTGASLSRMLAHAASVVGAKHAVVGWESDDEPWLYVADGRQAHDIVTKHGPGGLQTVVADRYGARELVSAAFQTEHLNGRVFFADIESAAPDLTVAVELVAREVGNSLEQLYVAERLRQLAVREDRIRLARDLHDGVLQSLTGIRLELQAIADERGMPVSAHDRLLGIERALATEQRELRRFIEEMKPSATAPVRSGTIANRLDEMCTRLSAEWKAPIVLRVTPTDLGLPQNIEQAVPLMMHEAIVNALKHAHPSRVAVTVDASQKELTITVADDGRGFPFRGRLEHTQLVDANVGPASLRDRVTALDGRMSVESSPAGSRVEFVLPIAASRPDVRV